MTLSEIRRNLDRLGVHPSRRLGQNFLHDQNVARRIADLAGIGEGGQFLEIGPGLGALTQFLVSRDPSPVLVEKDIRLAGFLKERFPQARVIEGDAMEVLGKSRMAKPSPAQKISISSFEFRISNLIVIGNLPYSVASPLMVRLCERDLRPPQMVFTIQKEVALRLVAKPRVSDYGLLTLLTQPFYEISIVRKVPPTVFWPSPEVSSAVVTMIRREKQPFTDKAAERNFHQLVSMAFQKRRKTLGSIFGDKLPGGMDRMRRPEELDLQEWIQFSKSAVPDEVEDEWFDIVNEQDKVVGKAGRKETHRKGLIHRAVHVFIWNLRDELLLQKRSMLKREAPGTWDSSVSGHLHSGEDYDEAAEREVEEEINVSPPLRKVQKFEACRELGWEFVWLYEGKSEGPFSFPSDEISELRWWKVLELQEELRKNPAEFSPSFRHLWNNRQKSSRI